jgi:hypothetical protein
VLCLAVAVAQADTPIAIRIAPTPRLYDLLIQLGDLRVFWPSFDESSGRGVTTI